MTRAALAAAIVMVSAPTHARLVIDEVDTDGFMERNEIRFFANVLDDVTGNVVKGLEAAAFKVFIDDVEVPGTLEVKTLREANHALGVAILMTASAGYAVPLDGTRVILDEEKAGFVEFLKRLTDQDRVAAWSVDEMGVHMLHAWSNTPARAAQDVDTLLKPSTENEHKIPPPLYAAIAKVVNAMIEEEANLPRERLLVVMSDGHDTNTVEKPARVEAKIREIAERAGEHGIKVVAIGFTADMPEGLVTLASLASKSNGTYRAIETFERIRDDIANVASELQGAYVLTFKPTAYPGSEAPANVRVEFKAKDGSVMKRVVADVRLPVRFEPAAASAPTTTPPAAGATPPAGTKGGCGGCASGEADAALGLVVVLGAWRARRVRRSLPSRSARGA